MKNILSKLSIPVVCSALIFSACGTAGTKNYSGGPTNINKNSAGVNQITGSSGTVTGTTGTTNTTSTKANSTPYSGSGLSTTLENQLANSGFTATRVLVIDDTVILGAEASGTSGTKGTPSNTNGAGTIHNLNVAQSQIQSILGGVRVLTVSNPEAVRAMERVRNKMKTTNLSGSKLSNDLELIIRSARQSTSTNQTGSNTK